MQKPNPKTQSKERKTPNQISVLLQLSRGEVSNKIIQGVNTQLCLHGMERAPTAKIHPGKPKYRPISTNPGYKCQCQTAEPCMAQRVAFRGAAESLFGQQDNYVSQEKYTVKKGSLEIRDKGNRSHPGHKVSTSLL